MSLVQPVARRRAEFWMICSLLMLMLDAIGDQIVLAYSSMGLVMALYVLAMVSFCLPQVVPVRDFRMLMVEEALDFVSEVWWLKVRLGSRYRPRTLGFLTVGMV